MCEREGERERYARTYTHVIYCGIRCASDLNYTHTRNFGTSAPTKEHASPRTPLGGLPPPRRPPRTVAHPRVGPKVTNRHSDHHDACLSFGQEACSVHKHCVMLRTPGGPWSSRRRPFTTIFSPTYYLFLPYVLLTDQALSHTPGHG